MPRAQCSSCADSGICPECRGEGKRVRVYGILFLRRREVVTCKLCRGWGGCRLCSAPDQEEHGAPAGQRETVRVRHLRRVGGGSG